MAQAQTTTVEVVLLGQTYRVKCAADEVRALEATADLVDRAMREVQNADGGLSLDRIAVMAALNIANGHLPERQAPEDAKPQLQRLTAKLDAALSA